MLGAHLFIFYYAILSAITPPVALSGFVAAGIAKTNPMKVGYTSVLLAPFIYIIPFMFIYNPGILMEGGFVSVITGMSKILLMIFPVALLSRLYWIVRLNFLEIIIAVGSLVSVLFFGIPGIFISIVMEAAIIVLHLSRVKIKRGSI